MALDWERACSSDELWPGELLWLLLDGVTPVVLVHLGDEVAAYQGECPHQRTSLEDADFDGEVITCPAHLWTFCARTGKGVNPTGVGLVRYPTQIRNDEIYLGLGITRP